MTAEERGGEVYYAVTMATGGHNKAETLPAASFLWYSLAKMGSNGGGSDCAFFYSVQGQIEDGDFPLSDKLYVKTSYHHGADWQFRHVSNRDLNTVHLYSLVAA